MSLTDKLKSLTPVQQRRAAALLGALVADAAMTPLHWIYDQGKVAGLIEADKDGGGGVFYPTSQCPYYTVPVGSNSAYGEQLFVTLKNIAENKGFDEQKLSDAIFKHYGPGTIFEAARNQSGSPIKGPWTNHCVKIMVANREAGKKPAGDTGSKDPDGLCKSIAVAALFSGTPNLKDGVEKCVNTCQLNPMAVDYAQGGIALLDHMIQNGEDNYDTSASAEVNKAIDAARKDGSPHSEAVKKYGLACSFPASFLGVIHNISHATGYESAVREELKAAGDNCSRGTYVGAYCGAKYGLDSIPESYLKKYERSEEAIGYIETLVQL